MTTMTTDHRPRISAVATIAAAVCASTLAFGVGRGPAALGSAGTATTNAAAGSTPPSSVYDADVVSEGTLLDEWTGVGPFTSEFPCGALSVSAAAEIVPTVVRAAVDGPCYYVDANDDDVFWVTVNDLTSGGEAGTSTADEFVQTAEQRFYNRVYFDGTPPAGEECRERKGVGDQAVWCAAVGSDWPSLIVVSGDVGVELESDEFDDEATYVAIAEAMLGPQPEAATSTTLG